MSKNKSYEELMERLVVIIEELESGDVTIEESTKKYEEGINITKKLNEILSVSEKKIKIMEDGIEEDF
ncbi:MAG: exodeoxyribonuclease VII small subunit [Clostridium sp.]|nr:exodeoxyribonuclease VII small subunit [Clostridium sp.]